MIYSWNFKLEVTKWKEKTRETNINFMVMITNLRSYFYTFLYLITLSTSYPLFLVELAHTNLTNTCNPTRVQRYSPLVSGLRDWTQTKEVCGWAPQIQYTHIKDMKSLTHWNWCALLMNPNRTARDSNCIQF